MSAYFKVRIDIMNRNAITSLAMLYALWQSSQQDLLDLISPFVLYAVGKMTQIEGEIDVGEVALYMEKEFGYKSFQPMVVTRVLTREASSRKKKENQFITKKNKQFVLKNSLSDFLDGFSEKRTACKQHADAVTTALASFLNDKKPCNNGGYTQSDAERFLLSFFEGHGTAILLSVDDLRQIRTKDNGLDYFVGRFILQENEAQSVLFDYLVELVKGYYVTTALYLQAENPNVTTSSFKDVSFFMDTRQLLAYLGFKSDPENKSVQEMVYSLQRNGASIKCFKYNLEEVDGILEAYKFSTTQRYRGPSTMTLEYFDEHRYAYTHVEAAQKKVAQRLKADRIDSVSPQEFLEENGVAGNSLGLLDEKEIEKIVLSIKPKYNLSTLPNDLSAINAVSRVRQGKVYPDIERCKAVFVTSNPVLEVAARRYLATISQDSGFPLIISDEDLCIMAWLKDFEQSNSLPEMRLLENVLAATTPTTDLMEAYYSHLENLEKQGEIDVDEVSLLRVDQFARRELMEATHGNKANLTGETIKEIRRKVREGAVIEGRKGAQEEYARKENEQRNRVCKRAEDDVEKDYIAKEKHGSIIITAISVAIAIAFIAASVWMFYAQPNSPAKWILAVVTIVTTIQGALPFFSKDSFLIKWNRKRLEKKKLKAIDERKERYLSLLDE